MLLPANVTKSRQCNLFVMIKFKRSKPVLIHYFQSVNQITDFSVSWFTEMIKISRPKYLQYDIKNI